MTAELPKDWGYLSCPDCDVDAVPASSFSRVRGYLWTEDDEAKCPECGQLVGVSVEDVDDEEYAAAYPVIREAP